MNKDLFIETENKLHRYYQKDKLIDSLERKVKMLDNQIKSINQDLRTSNISIEPESKSPGFEERVQSSGDGTSYVEREIIRVTEFRIRRMTEKQLEREKILEQIDKIELDYNFIKDAIESVKGVYRELIKMKYEKRMGEQQIASIMNWSQSEINKKKWKLIKLIADWDQWNKIS